MTAFFLTSPFPETSALQHRAEAINSLQRRPERSRLKPETRLTLGQHSPALPPSGTGSRPGWSENTQTVMFPEVWQRKAWMLRAAEEGNNEIRPRQGLCFQSFLLPMLNLPIFLLLNNNLK